MNEKNIYIQFCFFKNIFAFRRLSSFPLSKVSVSVILNISFIEIEIYLIFSVHSNLRTKHFKDPLLLSSLFKRVCLKRKFRKSRRRIFQETELICPRGSSETRDESERERKKLHHAENAQKRRIVNIIY